SLAKEIMDGAKFRSFEISDISEVTSDFEIADTIVDDLRETYGIEYTVPTDIYLLNREIHAFLDAPKEERMEIWEGKRKHHKNGPFVFLMDLLKKLKKIKQRELDRFDIMEEEKRILNSDHHGDFFLVWIFHIKPVVKLIKQNKPLFSKLNLVTEEAIAGHIQKTMEGIVDRWTSGNEPVEPEELFRRLEVTGLDVAALRRGEIDIIGNRINRDEL
ncbi:hypothetical protein PMAYCL1PPCAC_01243, partial [Pristionchus mayeri]